MIAHSVALRASQTAGEIAAELELDSDEFEGIHEVQVGDLEDRNDDAAIAEFETVYQRWHEGDLDVRVPGGETGRAGAGPLPAGDHPAAAALSRRRPHRAATSSWSAMALRSGSPQPCSAAWTAALPSTTTSATPNRLCWRRLPTGGGAASSGAR